MAIMKKNILAGRARPVNFIPKYARDCQLWRKAFLLSFVVMLASSTVVFSETTAFVPPPSVALDPNGVDLGSTHFVKSQIFLTIGDPDKGGLAWGAPGIRNDSYSGAILYWRYYVGGVEAPYEHFKIKMGSGSDSFYSNTSSGAPGDNEQGEASTLVRNAGSGTWIYTKADGSIYTFDEMAAPDTSSSTIGNVQFIGKLLSIAKPDGTVITINYTSSPGCAVMTCYQIRSVVSNRGYALRYEYSTSTIPGTLARVWAINLNVHNCDATVTSCDAYDNYVDVSGSSYTDSLGNSTILRVSGGSNAVTGYQEFVTQYTLPTGESYNAAYDGYGRIKTLTTPLGVWNYAYSDGTWTQIQNTVGRTITIRDPANALFMTAWGDKAHGVVDWTKDAQLRQTNYFHEPAYMEEGPYRLKSVQKPESNKATYAFDLRGNVTSVTQTPKSGSGLSATVITASYSSTCSNTKTCNQPNWTRDAKGQQTDYTYDPTHGGLLTITLPVDQNGLRQRTYNTYTGFNTGNGTIYRLTRSETCGLSAGQLTYTACPATSTTSVSLTDYGTSNTAPYTYKSSLPYQITQTDGAGSLSAVTTYGYDVIGNVTSIDGPLAGSDDTVFKTYDANRRVLCEIGADPDGSGALIRAMVRHTYDAAGRETKTEQGTGTSTSSCLLGNMTVASFTRNTFDTAGRLAKTEVVQP